MNKQSSLIPTFDAEYATELLTELKRRQTHYAKYTPKQEKGWDQLKIHKSNAHILLIFGGNQSGKSMCAAKETEWRLSGQHPFKECKTPILAWCVSSSYATLKNGIYRHLIDNIPDWQIERKGPRVQGYDMHSFIELKNGSRVEFHSAKGYEEAREKLQAAKVDVINIDEEIPEVVYTELAVRQLATENPTVIISATLINSEPYILNLEERADQGDPDICLTRLDTRYNPYVNKKILHSIMENMDAETIEYRIYGKSRRFAGLVYRDFHPKRHIIKSYPIPREWPRYQGIDPGIRTFAILYLAVSPDGHKIIYDELYLHGTSLHEVVDIMRAREGWEKHNDPITMNDGSKITRWKPTPSWQPIQARIIDDKRGTRLITGEYGVLEQLNITYGINCIPAQKDKRIGIERCRQSLQGETFVFNTCEHFIREIRQYRYRQDRSRVTQNETIQEPLKKDDHLLDAWRYIMITNPQYFPVRDLPHQMDPNCYRDSEDIILERYREKMRKRWQEEHGLQPICTGMGEI